MTMKVYNNATVILHKSGGVDEFNHELDGTTEEIEVHVEWKSKLIRSKTGDEEVATGKITMSHRPDIGYDDYFEIGGVNYEIAQIHHPSAFSDSKTEVYIK